MRKIYNFSLNDVRTLVNLIAMHCLRYGGCAIIIVSNNAASHRTF